MLKANPTNKPSNAFINKVYGAVNGYTYKSAKQEPMPPAKAPPIGPRMAEAI